MNEVLRDEHGRFLPGGAPKSPGRPRREVEEKYHTALVGKVSDKDWLKIIEKAVEQAKAGDRDARNFLANYLLGKPRESVDVTSADLPVAINIGYVPPRVGIAKIEDEENAQ